MIMNKVINDLFASVFNNETSCSWGIQPPELEDRMGNRMKPSNNQKFL